MPKSFGMRKLAAVRSLRICDQLAEIATDLDAGVTNSKLIKFFEVAGLFATTGGHPSMELVSTSAMTALRTMFSGCPSVVLRTLGPVTPDQKTDFATIVANWRRAHERTGQQVGVRTSEAA